MVSGSRRYLSYRSYRVHVAVIAVLVLALALGGVVVVSHGHSRSANSAAPPPGATTPPHRAAIAFTDLRSKMGVSTGAQLWTSPAAEIDEEIAGIAAAGARWIRTALHWRDVEPASAAEDDWTKADQIVTDAQAAGLSLVFAVGGAPDWAGAATAGEFGNDPVQYAAFAAKVATRYAGRVSAYELGNEPNLVNYVTHPSTATYTEILRAAYPAIKAIDPGAFVLSGGLGGTRDKNGNISGANFAAQLYAQGAKGFFDGIAYHPYTYPQLASTEAIAGGRGWSNMLEVRATMVQYGDGAKPIWITEFGAPTQGPNSVSEEQQAAILHDGFDLWQTYSWGGVMSWFAYHDKATDSTSHKGWFGLVDGSGRHKPSYEVFAGLLPPATSNYTPTELAAVDGAAQKLGVDRAEVQNLGSAALAWVLGLTSTILTSPVPNVGTTAITTDRSPSNYGAFSAIAGTHSSTLPEFQKAGALFLAFVLALPASASPPPVAPPG